MNKSEIEQTRIIFGYNQLLNAASLTESGWFNLSAFEDFNKLVESVVLYDKVVLLGDYDLPSNNVYNELKKEDIFEKLSDNKLKEYINTPKAQAYFKDSIQSIFGADSLSTADASPEVLLNSRISPNMHDRMSFTEMTTQTVQLHNKDTFNTPVFTGWLRENVFKTRNLGGHFSYIARSLVYSAVAESANMDYAPDFLRLPVAALAFSKRTSPASRLLYDALVQKMQSEIESLALLGMPIAIFIPPLTAKVLSQMSRPNKCAVEILELRHKFAKFRKTYGEFSKTLQDPDLTLREKMAVKKRLVENISGVIESGEGQHALNVRTMLDKVIGSDFGDTGVSTKLSLSGAVSILIEQVLKEYTKGHAKALFDLWTDVLNIKNYGALIEKSFRTELDSKEIEFFKNYSSAIRSIIRSDTRM